MESLVKAYAAELAAMTHRALSAEARVQDLERQLAEMSSAGVDGDPPPQQ
ncbi:hypothetical protein [Actinomyces ruminis]|nr:hypothetical protein [Actinomyces ruminis]